MRRPLLVSFALAVAAVTISAGPAAATNTVLGEAATANATTSAAGGGHSAFQDVTPPTGAPSYVVPAGGGVITSWSVVLQPATAVTHVALLVGRAHYDGFNTIQGWAVDGVSDTEAVPVESAQTLLTFTDARIPVHEGAVLGIWSDRATVGAVGARSLPGATVDGTGEFPPTTSAPATGDALTSDTNETKNNTLLEISATVEPDADLDGYGDTTQDACPTEPAAHLAPCPTELNTTLVAAPTTAKTGTEISVTATVKNTSQVDATDLTVHNAPTSGLKPLRATTSRGKCTSPISCHVGALPAGQSATIVLSLSALAPGSQSVTVTVTGGDQTLLGTTLATTIESILRSGPAVTIAPCRVPVLRGKGLAAAKKALAMASCRVGFITFPKLHTGQRRGQLRVVSQSRWQGTILPSGARVGFTLAVPTHR